MIWLNRLKLDYRVVRKKRTTRFLCFCEGVGGLRYDDFGVVFCDLEEACGGS